MTASSSRSRAEAADGGRRLDTRELESALGFWLRLAQQLDLKTFSEALAEDGISQPLFAMLLLIDANPGCRQADLGAVLRMRQPNLVEPIEGLIGRGLVVRRPDPADRRAQTLALTRKGKTLLKRLRVAHERLIGSYRERLGPEGYDQLAALLSRFVAAGRART